MQPDLVVDLSFRLRGSSIPADHGYALCSAVSRHLPWIHGERTVGIHPIRGQLLGQRRLGLTGDSRLVLRLPVSKVADAVSLAGQHLELDGAAIYVGVPSVLSLSPAVSLASRLVVIRGFTDAVPFLEAVQRHLGVMGVEGRASLIQRRRLRSVEGTTGSRDAAVRRTLRIHDREVIGFAVRVDGLGVDHSLALQTSGLGGRRRFGCGIFVPAPERLL